VHRENAHKLNFDDPVVLLEMASVKKKGIRTVAPAKIGVTSFSLEKVLRQNPMDN
jgi:hypothetical protein